jgi:ubiquitin thioesterase OTU1
MRWGLPIIQKYVFRVISGENENYSRRVFLIYDGIHYDPLEVIKSDNTPVQTVFNIEDDAYIVAAHHVGDEARKVIKF